MARNEILDIVREFKRQVAETYGILKIGIFGSTSRDEAGEASDVDVVVEIKEPDLFTLAGIKNDLEDKLHRPVDVVMYHKSMNKFLKRRIDEEAVYV